MQYCVKRPIWMYFNLLEKIAAWISYPDSSSYLVIDESRNRLWFQAAAERAHAKSMKKDRRG